MAEKMPAPITAPIPSITRARAPTVRLSPEPPFSISATMSATDLVRNSALTWGSPRRGRRRPGLSESRHDSMRVFAGRRVSTRGDPMLVVMRQGATQEEIAGVVRAIETRGFKAHPIPGAQRTAIGITGNRGTDDRPVFESMPGVLEVIPVTHAYKLVSREVKPEDSVVSIGGVPVGGGSFVIVAGPCAVESEEQMLTVARAVKAKGPRLVRGGAYKRPPRPHS